MGRLRAVGSARTIHAGQIGGGLLEFSANHLKLQSAFAGCVLSGGFDNLANHKSALKYQRVSERRRARNRLVVVSTRTFIKKARTTIGEGDQNDARAAVVNAIRALDKAASKGILHKNNVARRKSRLMKRLAEMDAGR